jgi:membrane protein insertase Oxa1/YidC/SpoIIIJ
VKEFVNRFFENMSNPPEPGPELIPKRWRVPFFAGLALVSIIVLALLLRFVVLPGIDAQQGASPTGTQSGSKP